MRLAAAILITAVLAPAADVAPPALRGGAAAVSRVAAVAPVVRPRVVATPRRPGSAAPPATAAALQSDTPLHFVDVAAEAGLDVVTWCGRPHKPHLLESGGYGLALLDYDGDDDLDLYVVDGWRLEGSEVVDRGSDRLYRNRGDGTFEDVTEAAGLGHDGWGAAVAVGDIDGDGDPDLLVTNFGPDVLYRNQGDGTFVVDPDFRGIDGWSASSVFFDGDGDGDLDLFVTGYIEATLEEVLEAEPTLRWEGSQVMSGPFGMEGLANRYWVNDGDGTFREATEEAGLTDVGLFYSFAVAALDLDDDLDLDLYVANDSNPNYLYENQGDGTFREVGLWSGASLSASGAGQAGMGVAAGDVDGDSRPDLFVTNFGQDVSTLYRNLGGMMFENVTEAMGLRAPTYAPLSWGTALVDLDLDADLDLFVANGHIYPQADQVLPAGMAYEQANLLLEHRQGRFVEVGEGAGPGLQVRLSSRGVAVGDLDADGDLDFVVSNVDATPSLLRNDTERQGAWLMVDAPDALRVELTVGATSLVRHRTYGGSYASESDPRFHFGLGAVDSVDRLTVVWPDGSESVLEDVAAGQVVVVDPGAG